MRIELDNRHVWKGIAEKVMTEIKKERKKRIDEIDAERAQLSWFGRMFVGDSFLDARVLAGLLADRTMETARVLLIAVNDPNTSAITLTADEYDHLMDWAAD